MKVDLIDYMGSDLTVVNAARVSFAKHKDKFEDSDERLLQYLARNNHWTPYSHPQITVRVKAPIFVARQLFKHKVGMSENEVSRRYVDDDPEFYVPDIWRGRPVSSKQGSDGVVDNDTQGWAESEYEYLYSLARSLYHEMIGKGIAPEQARMILPQSMYTEWYWTGSLAAFARIYNLRSDPHAQVETQEIANMLDAHIRPLFPTSWEALVGS